MRGFPVASIDRDAEWPFFPCELSKNTAALVGAKQFHAQANKIIPCGGQDEVTQ